MKDQLNNIKIEAINSLKAIEDLDALEKIRVKYMGKKGELTKVLKGMGGLSKEERPIMGELANDIREKIENEIEEKKNLLLEAEKKIRLEKEKIDITINKSIREPGHRNPLLQTMEELENLFMSMGFTVLEGPEIETVRNNFDLLNSPKDHPAREYSDTFYISEELLLRTHTSPVQIRAMQQMELPIRIISTGRTFRFDDVDDTHSPMFHQLEGLVVDENITMGNLMKTIDIFIKEIFGEDMKTRFRPHNFPFTEPSIEVDISCFDCRGKGCPSCNGTGWDMELLGAGMVHPNVLENCGIDSEKYTGFAFGFGIDRIAMVKHKIDNIRLLFENDNRFLKQF